MPNLDLVTGAIVRHSVRIHRALGPGLLESVYEGVLGQALTRDGFQVEHHRPIAFEYDGLLFRDGLRPDLTVNGQVLVELKSVERLAPVHAKQLLTYLRLANLPVGLLINFGGATLIEGLRRIVNHLPPDASPGLRINQNTKPVDDGGT
jgi:iron complex transport system substrate-binding protein